MAFFGDPISADQAHALGLVDEVVAAEDLPACAEALAGRLAVAPTSAISLTKRLLNASPDFRPQPRHSWPRRWHRKSSPPRKTPDGASARSLNVGHPSFVAVDGRRDREYFKKTMSSLLDGKVALVTGAGHGIGRAHALELAPRRDRRGQRPRGRRWPARAAAGTPTWSWAHRGPGRQGDSRLRRRRRRGPGRGDGRQGAR